MCQSCCLLVAISLVPPVNNAFAEKFHMWAKCAAFCDLIKLQVDIMHDYGQNKTAKKHIRAVLCYVVCCFVIVLTLFIRRAQKESSEKQKNYTW